MQQHFPQSAAFILLVDERFLELGLQEIEFFFKDASQARPARTKIGLIILDQFRHGSSSLITSSEYRTAPLSAPCAVKILSLLIAWQGWRDIFQKNRDLVSRFSGGFRDASSSRFHVSSFKAQVLKQEQETSDSKHGTPT